MICLAPGPPPEGEARRAVLLDFADAVNALDGSYITAEDVGSGAQDMVVIGEVTRHVTGMPEEREGRRSQLVHRARPRGSDARLPRRALRGRRARRAEGRRRGMRRASGQRCTPPARGRRAARALNLDERRRELVDELPGATWSDPAAALLAPCDVLAPCALGGVIDAYTAGRLRCAIVCGGANNQLAHGGLADDLAVHGVLYAPDFIVNAGGLISVGMELEGYDRERVRARTAGIEGVIADVLDDARRTGVTPLAAAFAAAHRRLDRRRR